MKHLAWLWIATLLFKLLVSGFLPLAPDEAYYWIWSHHFQLSYYDHPPFVAWLMTLGHMFEETYSLIRWPTVIMGHLAFWFWIPVFKGFLRQKELLVWSALWLLNPLTGPGSLVVTPDLPLLFFWPLALWALLETLKTSSLGWASLFGLALGLGFCSKYHMALFGILALVWLIWDKRLNSKLIPAILVSIIAFLIASSPVWIWNWNNDFISFRFQMDHGLGRSEWKPFWTWSYLLGQVFLIFPLILWSSFKNFRLPSYPFWLKIFAFGPLVFFFLTSFRGKVEANWPIVAYPFVLAMATVGFRGFRLWVTSIVWGSLIAFLILDLGLGLLPIDKNPLKTKEIRVFESLGETTRQYRPLFAHSYQMASKLSFDLKEPIFKLKGNGRRDFFDALDESSPQAEKFFFLTYSDNQLPMIYSESYTVVQRIDVGHGYQILEVHKQ